jgi:hypothetical protein
MYAVSSARFVDTRTSHPVTVVPPHLCHSHLYLEANALTPRLILHCSEAAAAEASWQQRGEVHLAHTPNTCCPPLRIAHYNAATETPEQTHNTVRQGQKGQYTG